MNKTNVFLIIILIITVITSVVINKNSIDNAENIDREWRGKFEKNWVGLCELNNELVYDVIRMDHVYNDMEGPLPVVDNHSCVINWTWVEGIKY